MSDDTDKQRDFKSLVDSVQICVVPQRQFRCGTQPF
jgi:hypothetical protein